MYLRLLTVMHTSFLWKGHLFSSFFKQGHVEKCLLYVLFSSVIYIFIFYFGWLGVGLGHCFCIYMSCSTSAQE